MSPSPIFNEVDLDAPGKQHGYLRLPHSVHRSAYGWIPIPITSVKNGDGPVVLLMAGNHGDEYEGQIALANFARSVQAEDIHGQIIILPMANFPAAKAGQRTSPLDQGNLNRSFPGNPQGSPTQMIAHFIESELLSRSDYLIDMHSGGSSLIYIPSVLLTIDPDSDQHQANLAMVRSLGFPQCLLFKADERGCYSSSAARRKNCVGITIEAAGGGSVNPEALTLLEYGLMQYLGHIGIITQVSTESVSNAKNETQFFVVNDQNGYCFCYHQGLFQPLVGLGDTVYKDQTVALIHHPDSPGVKPDEIVSPSSGQIVSMRMPAQAERGDCLYEIAEKVDK